MSPEKKSLGLFSTCWSLLFHWLQMTLNIDSSVCYPSIFLLHKTWNCQASRAIQLTTATKSHWFLHLFLPEFKSIFHAACHIGLTCVTRCCYMPKWCITIQTSEKIIHIKCFSTHIDVHRQMLTFIGVTYINYSMRPRTGNNKNQKREILDSFFSDFKNMKLTIFILKWHWKVGR